MILFIIPGFCFDGANQMLIEALT